MAAEASNAAEELCLAIATLAALEQRREGGGDRRGRGHALRRKGLVQRSLREAALRLGEVEAGARRPQEGCEVEALCRAVCRLHKLCRGRAPAEHCRQSALPLFRKAHGGRLREHRRAVAAVACRRPPKLHERRRAAQVRRLQHHAVRRIPHCRHHPCLVGAPLAEEDECLAAQRLHRHRRASGETGPPLLPLGLGLRVQAARQLHAVLQRRRSARQLLYRLPGVCLHVQ
mmetsp:Transcript_10183/g.41447  ORF Transcript_10183/g.41447 Transcript_10183/m.41447 type:complete len:230 (-) Transcript_10183:640-1329(-)